MSRDPSKSRPLSDNVKRMMWLERASPRSSDVYSAKREFTENDRLFCHKQGLLFMEAAAMGLRMEDFTPLYPVYRYRLQGMKIRYNNEQMYLFDLNAHECFLPQKKDAATGKVKASAAEFPQDWQSSFGMKVAEHDMSTQVNFLDGYISPSDTEQTEGSNE